MPDYPWKRFWCLRDGSYRPDFDGFLADPDEEFGGITNPAAKTLQMLAGIRFLGLVGEAGTGKSKALEREFDNFAPRTIEVGDLAMHFNLRDIASGSELDQAIFQTDWFRDWRAGESALYLFLDALDECYERSAVRILSRLSDLPLQRLFVRVACRTASWPRTFDNELPKLFEKRNLGAEPYAVYELLPLRRKDVELAAVAESVDSAHFIEEIKRRDVVPLAAKPVTLSFLITAYKVAKTLPSSSVKLYLDGCRNLATEMSDTRRDAKATGKLDPEQRVAIAERVAAVMLFGNRQAMWTGKAERPNTDLAPSDILDVEWLGERRVDVSESRVLEVLDTGLFSARGETRFGWSHQTFGEFLAAHYLIRHGFAVSQMLSLVTTPGDPTRSVRPQLDGTAAWLASMNDEIREALLDADPIVLLLSDATTLVPEVRQKLTSRLLGGFEKTELLDRQGVLFRFYWKLAHPGIAEQIRSYVVSPELSVPAKHEAIAIARACGSKELSGFFADIALDGSVPLQLRVSAVYAVDAVGDPESKKRLVPLAAGVPEDSDDELKGAALDALWPGVLTTGEIFQYLTRRRNPNLIGSYHVFLARLPKQAREEDVPLLLRWVGGLGKSYSRSHLFGRLGSEILNRSWSLADRPEVMAGLLVALRNLERTYFEKSETDWTKPEQRRRLLVEHLVSSFGSRDEASKGWPSDLGIPIPADFEWMLGRFRDESEERRPIWVGLLTRVFNVEDAKQVDALLRAAKSSDLIPAEFRWCLGSVDLNSEVAEEGRRAWQERVSRDKQRNAQRRDGHAALNQVLDLSDGGKSEAWSWIPWALSITAEGKDLEGHFAIDLPARPGWLSAGPKTRERIVRAAKRFLVDSDPRTSEWLGTNTFDQRVSAAIAAFTLLRTQFPAVLSEFSAEIWERWAPAIVSFSPFEGKGEGMCEIRRGVYANAPSAVLEALAKLIDAEDERSGSTFAIAHVNDFWDDRVANLLLTKLKKPGLKNGTFSGLLRKLLEHENQEAARVAGDLIKEPLPLDPSASSKVISAGVVLLTHDSKVAWPLVWPRLIADEVFAREFLAAAARERRPDYSGLFDGLPESQAGDLYVLLSTIFPHSRDRRASGMLGPDDEGRMFRDSLLEWLKHRGTREACDSIASIGGRLPHLAWMKRMLLEADELRRRKAAGWPRPEEILTLAANRSRRLVRDATELADVLIEAFERLEKELHGETPAARDLWDMKTGRKTLFRPKPEDDLSDYIKRYLEREVSKRGVVVGREVRIHRGQRTDIHVDAVVESASGNLDGVSVIIEVKGCWNPELRAAMKTQLVGKYLAGNRCRHGLYLVCWFDCEAWDPHDPRVKKSHPKFDSINELKGVLASQAGELSVNGLRIRSLVLDCCLRR